MRAAIADTDTGQIFHQRQCPTLANEGQEAVIGRIVELIRELTQVNGSANSIKGVGIGVPGTPDIDTGVIQFLPNLPGKWLNVPLQSIVEDQIQLPVALINDVRAITLGEWTFGAGKGADTSGLPGDWHRHWGWCGGEWPIPSRYWRDGGRIRPSRCGGGWASLWLRREGLPGALCIRPAIAAMGVKEVMHGHTTRIGQLVNHDLNRIDAGTIVQAALEGDPIAQGILQRVGRYLGIAVGNILGVISPQRVIFGGGVSRAGDLLLRQLCRPYTSVSM